MDDDLLDDALDEAFDDAALESALDELIVESAPVSASASIVPVLPTNPSDWRNVLSCLSAEERREWESKIVADERIQLTLQRRPLSRAYRFRPPMHKGGTSAPKREVKPVEILPDLMSRAIRSSKRTPKKNFPDIGTPFILINPTFSRPIYTYFFSCLYSCCSRCEPPASARVCSSADPRH
jgi:hypothetical protein